MGGLAIYGGILGAFISVFIYCTFRKISFLDTTDYIIPYLALGQAIGRWGNFFNVEAYGIETQSILRMGIVQNGNYIQVHPTFLYESLGAITIFIILMFKSKKRNYSGQITLLYFAMYGFIRFFVEGLRTDSLMIGFFRVSQIISLLLALTSIVVLLINVFKKRKKK